MTGATGNRWASMIVNSSRWRDRRCLQLRVTWLLTVALAAGQRADWAPRLALRLDDPLGELGLHSRDRCVIHAFEPPISLSHSSCLLVSYV